MLRSARFYKYLGSYIVMVCMSLLIFGGLVYRIFIAMLENENEKSSQALLTQVRDAMDMRITELNRMAMQISLNPDLTPFMIDNGGTHIMNTQRTLKDYRSTNGFIYDIALFYSSKSGSRIFGASGIYDIDVFFDSIYGYMHWNKKDLLSFMNTNQAPVMRPLEEVRLYKTETKSFATYLYPIPINAGKPFGVVLFLIDEKAFAGMLQNVLKNNKGYSYVLNEKNEIIAYKGSDKEEASGLSVLLQLQISKVPQGITVQTAGINKVSVAKLTSDLNNWTYLTVVPTEQVVAEVHRIQKRFFYVTVAALLLGIGMSFVFSARIYKPLQALAKRIRKEVSYVPFMTGKQDEIQLISHVVEEVAKENRGLLTTMKTQASILKDQVLHRLLQGKFINAAELTEALNASSLSFSYPNFTVLLILIDDMSRFLRGNEKPMQSIMTYSLIHVVEELSIELGCGYGLERMEDGGIVLILNSNEEVGDAHLRGLSEKANDFFMQYFQFTLTVGIGETYCDDPMSLHKSYLEAVYAAKHRFILGSGRSIFYREIESERTGAYWYPAESEDLLIMAIKQGNEQEVRRTIRNIAASISENALSIEAVEHTLSDLINTVMKTLSDMGIDLKDYRDATLETLRASKYETIGEWETMIVQLCSKICEYIAEQKKSKNFELAPKIIAFVQHNFTDSSLTLDKIADHFGLSGAYMTRYFKDQTGYSLMRYLDIVRLNKAKVLLKTTDARLKSITEQVGLVDQSNFIRKFKKYEGITPNEYRSAAKGESSLV